MAIRPDKCIIRGEIDNTVRGRVTGRLWLVGRETPLILELSGDAWADVAGTKVAFLNSKPVADPCAATLSSQQTGRVGDITVSQRRKVFTAEEDEWNPAPGEDELDDVPWVWKNTFYLEWFSTANGRVVVETADYEITISGRLWEADADDDAAQQLLNMEAMRDFLERMVARADEANARWPNEMTEEEWEEALKESDRLTDASMEAEEKFRGDPAADAKEAFVMGWDHLPAAGAPRAEDGSPDAEPAESDESSFFADADVDDSDEEAYSYERHQHPLQIQAREYCRQVSRTLETLGLAEDRQERDSPVERLCGHVYRITGKLAGALNFGPDCRQPDGYVLAITRRCLNWANEALAALTELEAAHPATAMAESFTALRSGLFFLREAITELRRTMGRP